MRPFWKETCSLHAAWHGSALMHYIPKEVWVAGTTAVQYLSHLTARCKGNEGMWRFLMKVSPHICWTRSCLNWNEYENHEAVTSNEPKVLEVVWLGKLWEVEMKERREESKVHLKQWFCYSSMVWEAWTRVWKSSLAYLRQRHELTSVGKCSTFQGIARDRCQYSLSHNNADLILSWVLEGYYKLNFLHEIKGMYEIECTRCVQETAEQGHWSSSLNKRPTVLSLQGTMQFWE